MIAAVARPIPFAAAVISATLPAKRMMPPMVVVAGGAIVRAGWTESNRRGNWSVRWWHGSCAPQGVTKALSVLLIDDNPARAEIVEAGLRAAGYRLLARLGGTQDLTARVRELEPDVVVVS